MNTNTSPQPKEQGAMLPPVPIEQPESELAKYSRQQALLALKSPEMQISKEDRIRAHKIFKSQSPLKQLTPEENELLTRVQEYDRLVSIAKKDLLMAAEREMETFERARKDNWFTEETAKKAKAKGKKVA